MMKKSPALACLSLALVLGQAIAAEPTRDELTRQVEALDREFFDAFNNCKLDKLTEMVAEDLEFFHDKNGLMRSRQAFIEAVRRNVCGKFRREPMAGTMVVYPLEKFGAIQMGDHKFCPVKPGPCEGKGKYVNVWQRKGERWEMMRVLSYEHLPLTE
ncbi:nuclear transport factor 2 family protein [Pelomonas sp. SE-A7]|uniref:nuclear transport factor 2 family protein n=1 Tax=Pelomonas sp. SE-A7 TaxID=3054953 RepID=UPI00259CEE3F|nr:nuclear transport factor 2 family protein [Pelomonas sp. SE-A7]MDM4768410.1 nuclear transport factor 2 family protein [Pelomonas sp. SE-A7]